MTNRFRRLKPEFNAIRDGTHVETGALVRTASRVALLIAGALFGVIVTISALAGSRTSPGVTEGTPTVASFSPPDPKAIPGGPAGDAIRRGEAIFENTSLHAGDYVGNAMACKNCHLDSGRRAGSSPMWAAWVSYPQFRKKTGTISTMEDRILGCFRYSMNAPASRSGGPPPPGSDIYRDLQTYFHWLATGAPTGKPITGSGFPMLPRPAGGYDPGRGAPLFQEHCSSCHGAQGEGARQADGTIAFPPLWGKDSYNWGAGMARVDLAAAFIKANMPFDNPGTLSEQQAWDIAAFVDSRERPRDPRQTGGVAANAQSNFAGQESFYGQTVDGKVLGQGAR